MAPNRAPAPGQAPGPIFPPQGQHGMGGYMQPPSSAQGYPQMPYGYPGAQLRGPAPTGGVGGGGVPMQGGMPSYSPQPHMQPQPLPNLMGAPMTPASAPMSAQVPPPQLQQPLVPQQVGAPSPVPAGLPPASQGQQPPSGSMEGQGPVAPAVPNIRASQPGMQSVEGSLSGAEPDPLQARLENLCLQPPPEGALPQQGEPPAPTANQASQPINGTAHTLHQLEQKNGFVEPAPGETGGKEANGTMKHTDLLSDLDPLWSFNKS